MQIRVACSCGQEMLAPESLAGRVGRCPKCGAQVAIPAPGGPFPATASLPPEEPAGEPDVAGARTKSCPVCAEEILAEAVKCKHCGEYLEGRRGRPRTDRVPGRRRPITDRNSHAGVAAQETGNLSLIFGILAILVCGLIFGPLAIVKGNEAKRQAALARIPAPGGATAGVILGWIAIGLQGLGLLVFVLQFALLASYGMRW